MTTQYRPRIAVIGRCAISTSALRFSAIANARALLESIWQAGGEPLTLLPVAGVDWAERLRGVSGMLLPGGGDIAPLRYGESVHSASVYDVDDLQDAADFEAAKFALDVGLPVLAVCRGLHVVNVLRGGSLVQDMTSHHRQLLHDVTIDSSSEQFGFTTSELHVSCYHHQAIERLGSGIDVVGHASDGTIEAVLIDSAGWSVGVQWHPEDTAAEDPQQDALFRELVARARDHELQRSTPHD